MSRSEERANSSGCDTFNDGNSTRRLAARRRVFGFVTSAGLHLRCGVCLPKPRRIKRFPGFEFSSRACSQEGFHSTNCQSEDLRNEGVKERSSPVQKTAIRAAKTASANAYYIGAFFPRARGTRVESPGYRC